MRCPPRSAQQTHLADGETLGEELGEGDGSDVVGDCVGSGVTGRLVGLPDWTVGIGEGFELGAGVEGVCEGAALGNAEGLLDGGSRE